MCTPCIILLHIVLFTLFFIRFIGRLLNSLLYICFILEWTTSLDTSSSTLFVCRGLYPAGFIAHLRLYRHIRQAAIRDFFLFAVGSHAVIIYFGWLGLALYNIVVRIMVRVDVRVRVTQG